MHANKEKGIKSCPTCHIKQGQFNVTQKDRDIREHPYS